jgi:hypothetical protein
MKVVTVAGTTATGELLVIVITSLSKNSGSQPHRGKPAAGTR